jgi:hypothetical protein
MICFKPDGKVLAANTCLWITQCVSMAFGATVFIKACHNGRHVRVRTNNNRILGRSDVVVASADGCGLFDFPGLGSLD